VIKSMVELDGPKFDRRLIMQIAVIGINHHRASIEIREKVSFSELKKIETINRLLDEGIKEVVIVSTCNRSEIYIAAAKNFISDAVNSVVKLYSELTDGDDEYIFIKRGKSAAEHLNRVAIGLDSIVLGEDQILGQVKDAQFFSMEMGASKKVLNKLFREAVTLAKKIKSELKISEHPLSLSYIAVKYIKDHVADFQSKRIMVIGLGEMGLLCVKNLNGFGFENIYISNRKHGRVSNLIEEIPNLNAIEYENRYEVLKEMDIVISATASPHYIFKKDEFAALEKPLMMLDIAMPRDIDPELKDEQFVDLMDIDDFKDILEDNQKNREALAEKAEEMINEGVEEFLHWMVGIEVDPLINKLNGLKKEIMEDTLHYINRKMELEKRDKKTIEKMLGSSLNRVLREPIINLKKLKDNPDKEVIIRSIEKVFGFSD